MSAARFPAHVKEVVTRIVQDFGKYLLFLLFLNGAFLASLVGGTLFFGFLLAPEASIVTSVETGARTVAHLAESFTDRQSQFIISIWFTALLTGMATLWVYQQTLAKLKDLRRWMQTTSYR